MPNRRGWALVSAVLFLAAGCHGPGNTAVAVDPSGHRLYVSAGQDSSAVLRVVDLKTREIVDRIPLAGSVSRIAVNPTNGQIYVVGKDSISLLDATSSRVVSTLSVGSAINGIAVDAPGAQLLVLLEQGTRITSVDTAAFRIGKTMDLRMPLGGAAHLAAEAMPGPGVIYLLELLENESKDDPPKATLALRDTSTLSVIAWKDLGKMFPSDLAVHPRGTHVYVVGLDGRGSSTHGRFLALETGSHRIIADLPLPGVPIALAMSPDGAFVYLADYEKDALTVISTAANSIVSTLTIGDEPIGLAVNPATGELYVLLDDGSITVVNASGTKVLASLRP